VGLPVISINLFMKLMGEEMQQGSMLSTSLWLYKNVPYKRRTIFPLDESIVNCPATSISSALFRPTAMKLGD
jgi:hypothetical protein